MAIYETLLQIGEIVFKNKEDKYCYLNIIFFTNI